MHTILEGRAMGGPRRSWLLTLGQVCWLVVSQFMTLLPGDIISTGTPAGVGLGQKPEPIYLKPGDVVELGIDGLGESRQVAVEYRQ